MLIRTFWGLTGLQSSSSDSGIGVKEVCDSDEIVLRSIATLFPLPDFYFVSNARFKSSGCCRSAFAEGS